MGHLTWVGLETKRLRGSGRRRTITVPIVSRYVFVMFRDGQVPWHPLRAVKGWEGMVMSDGCPAVISDRVMLSFQSVCQSYANGDRAVHHSRRICSGDRVEFDGGAFGMWTAVVESVHGDEARVLREILGAPRVVRVPVDKLALVEAA